MSAAPWLAAAALLAAACAGSSSGVQLVRYPGGQVKWEVEMHGGVPHGNSRTFYPNGVLRSVGEYRNGRKQGVFIYYADDGSLERKTYYWHDTVVWSSTEPEATPPPELVTGLERADQREPSSAGSGGGDAGDESLSADFADLVEGGEPQPYFASLDRTVDLTRFGVGIGFGGSTADGASASRADLFGNVVLGDASVFAQISAARLAAMDETLEGRATAEVGGGYHLALPAGRLSPRVGLLVPIGNDDQAGFEAAAAASFQRPTDAIGSMPSTVALRTGTSWTGSGARWVAQADGGIDWAFGGAGSHVHPLGRLNGAIGLGNRSLLALAELSNAVRVGDPDQRLHALGIGGALWLKGVWTTLLVSRTSGDHTILTVGAGYGL